MTLQVEETVSVRGRISRGTFHFTFLVPFLTHRIHRYLEPDPMLLVSAPGSREEKTERHSKFHDLNRAIVQLVRPMLVVSLELKLTFAQIEDHPLVSFLPLNLTEPDSIETVLSHIDYTMQYGEDEEPKEVCDHF